MTDHIHRHMAGSSFATALVWVFGAMAMLCTAQSAQAGILLHGCAISKVCTGQKCIGSKLDCFIKVSYNDDFGDTTRVVSCFDIIKPGPGQVRVPAVGNLYVFAISGNTTAVVGGSLPVFIGPAFSTNNGLPGVPAPGFVIFAARPVIVDGSHPDLSYTIVATDPNPVPDQGNAEWQDQCNVQPVNCITSSNFLQASGSTSVIHPNLNISVNSSSTMFCPGTGTAITYTYTVTNRGDVALSNLVVTDNFCGPVVFIGGDTNANAKLDLGEVWIYSCTRNVTATTTNTATVNADSPDPLCHRIANAQTTVTPNPSCCTGDVVGNGFVNVDDLLFVINHWGACPAPCPPFCAADVTHNCFVNVDDLLAVINHWGACP